MLATITVMPAPNGQSNAIEQLDQMLADNRSQLLRTNDPREKVRLTNESFEINEKKANALLRPEIRAYNSLERSRKRSGVGVKVAS